MGMNPDPAKREEALLDALINIVSDAEEDTDWGGNRYYRVSARAIENGKEAVDGWFNASRGYPDGDAVRK